MTTERYLTPLSRFLIALTAYWVAAALCWALLVSQGHWKGNIDASLLLLGVVFFPVSFGFRPSNDFLTVLPYFLYPAFIVALTFTHNRKWFLSILGVFVTVLSVNVAACVNTVTTGIVD